MFAKRCNTARDSEGGGRKELGARTSVSAISSSSSAPVYSSSTESIDVGRVAAAAPAGTGELSFSRCVTRDGGTNTQTHT